MNGPTHAGLETDTGRATLVADNKGTNYLGSLFWFSVPGFEKEMQEVRDAFTNAGLPEESLPKPTRADCAFRKASTEADGKDVLVRHVTAHKRAVVAGKPIEQQDGKALPVIGHWTFDPESGSVGEMLDREEYRQQWDTITPRFKLRFQEMIGRWDDSDLRQCLTDAMRQWRATALRPSGGVYFAPREHREALLKWATAVKTLGGEMWEVPVVDGNEQRHLVAVKFEQEAVENLKGLVEEMVGLIKGDKPVQARTIRRFTEDLQYYRDAVARYKELIATKLDTAEAELEVVTTHIQQLAERAG